MRYDRLARIERIERAIAAPVLAGPLSRHERVELAELERERRERFPRPIDDMDMHELRGFMAWSCGDSGSARRLDQLRQRARSPEERAEGRAVCLAIRGYGSRHA